MNEGIKKLIELMNTDKGFQEKLQKATEAYRGEPDEKAAFDSVVAPLAAEYGIRVSYEEMKACVDGMKNAEMSPDELNQVAGGDGFFGITGGGIGVGCCDSAGWGMGGGYSTDGGFICFIRGYGTATVFCATAGMSGPGEDK